MELIERNDLKFTHYLHSLTFAEFKTHCSKSCKNDDERRTKFNIMKGYCETAIKTNGEKNEFTHIRCQPSKE